MSSCRSVGACLALAALAACAANTPTTARPGAKFGRAATAQEVAAWDISIPPSGEGLPWGSGNAKQGEAVYAAKCQACHGARGVGKPADPLVGGIGSLVSANPVRTVGSYWPYATTLFDYTRRAMPVTNPQSLTNDEAYAVTAYLLYLNGIVAQSDEMNAKSLPQVKMPNREGFVDWSRN
ncbi:MAG TPA: cytochrome c [Burkholderiales bacterium]|nr:cytochrome c [Burkholderiales bacterium]